MKLKFTVLLFIAVVLNIHSVDFPNYGFSIPMLDVSPGPEGGQALQMLLPPRNGFSGNVNVQIQPYSGSIGQYKKLSHRQYDELGLNVISEEITSDSYIVEYTGYLSNMDLHFYAMAIKKDDYVYLATATDLIINWEYTGRKLIDVIDGFELK